MTYEVSKKENMKIQCPFCEKETIDAIYYPPMVQAATSRISAGSKTKFYKTKERYEILSECSNCGKSKKEIEKAMKEGVPADKERLKKRYEEVMKLREELRREKS